MQDQILGSSDPTKWTGEGFGSAQANARNMAEILNGIGITDIKDFGKITVQVPDYDEFGNQIGTHPETTYGNKRTGQAVPNTYGERQTGDAFGGTYAGSGNTGYRVQFLPDGSPVFYTSEQSSSNIKDVMPLIQLALLATGAGGLLGGALNSTLGLGLGAAGEAALGGATIGGLTSAATGGNVLQGALLGGAGGYLSGSLGTPATTDAGLLAADASQLAAQGLTESQIAQVLGANGYATTGAANLAASMASNGLSIDTMTNQLQNLSTNTGLLQQNISPGSFAAYDAMGLKEAIGNDFAAIEQNLTASGVDPLIAADISQQLAFNPNITHQDLASHLTNTYGNNIYDVNTATTYPTSTLGGAGGSLSNALSAGITDQATQIASGNGAWLGENVPSGVPEWDTAFTNAGGTFDTAYTTPTVTATRTDLPEASYSNEGRNYPTPASTQGTGGSPANASVATSAGLPLVDTTSSGLNISPNTAINAARLAAGLLGGSAGAGALTNAEGGTNVSPTQTVPVGNQDYYNAIQQYYNAYMPTQPRDVSTPLMNWYSQKYGTALPESATTLLNEPMIPVRTY